MAILSRESVSGQQIVNILNIFTTVSHFVAHCDLIDDGQKPGGLHDGGARTSAEVTLINCCARLDAMLSEPGRWDMSAQSTLESDLSECYAQHARACAAQAAVHENMMAPHFRFKPQLMKLLNGDWVAICGSLADLDNSIVGMGNCPQQAIDAFDAIFKGRVPEHLKEFLAAREAAIAEGKDPLEWSEFGKSKLQNEKSQVDERRIEHPKNPPRKRKVNPRNRREDGPEPEVS